MPRIDRPAGHILELLDCVVELHLLLLDALTEGVQSLIGGSTHVEAFSAARCRPAMAIAAPTPTWRMPTTISTAKRGT